LGFPEYELTYTQREGASNQTNNAGPDWTGAGAGNCNTCESAYDAWQRIDANQQPTQRSFKADANENNDERHGSAPPRRRSRRRIFPSMIEAETTEGRQLNKPPSNIATSRIM
jgi:hypothetical protein